MKKLLPILLFTLLLCSCSTEEPKEVESTEDKEEANKVDDWEEIIVDESDYTITES